MSEEVDECLRDVDRYGPSKFPVGKDRAYLCRATVVLAPEVRALRAKLAAVEAKAKTLESERDAWAVKHADALAENKLLRKIRDRAIGFRDHGESKNGTHAMFLFGALADFEKNQETGK